MAETVIAHHDYEAQQDDELSFIAGETIKVTDHSNADWWLGSKPDGSSGYFPSNFVEATKQDKEKPAETGHTTITTATVNNDKETTTSPTPAEPTTEDNATIASTNETETSPVAESDEQPKQRPSIGMARVMEDYAMQQDDELTLHKGGIVVLYERSDDGEWLQGEINGKQGRFPAKYVEDIDMPGRPDLGMNNPDMISGSGESGAKAPPPGGFKLAAFGVKQGGIGSLLAGGIPTLKKTSAVKSPTESQPQPQPISTPPPAPAPAPVPAAAEATQQPKDEISVPSLGKAIVLHPYDAENNDELNLIRGEYIDILDRHADEGWWQGRNEKNQTGVFPNNFVKEIEHDQGAPPPPVRTRKSVASVGAVTSTTSPIAPPPESRPFSTPTSSLLQRQQSPPTTVSQRLPPLPDTRPPAPVTIPKDEGTTTTDQVKQDDTDSMDVKESLDTPAEDVMPADTSSSPLPPAAPAAQEALSSPHVEPSLSEAAIDSVDQQPQHEEAAPVPSPQEPVETKPAVVEQQPQQPSIETVDQTESPATTPAATAEEEHFADSNKDDHTQEEPKDTSTPTVEETSEPKEEEVNKSVTTAPVESVEEPESTDEQGASTTAAATTTTTTTTETAEQEPKDSELEQQQQQEEETKKGVDFGLPLPTSGPRLVTPNRTSRPSNRAGTRRPPTKPSTDDASPSQTELLQQELEKAPEEEKPAVTSPTSPPPKPIKPIFAKFPTPFAGGPEGISAKNLKPVQRRMFEPSPAHEPSPSPPPAAVASDDNDANARPSGGVRGLASRFAGLPNTGGGNEVMETKLRNFTKNEVEKTRKEFEGLLELERARIATLESMVEALMRKVDQLENGDDS